MGTLYILIPYILLFYVLDKARYDWIFLLGIPFLQLFYLSLFTKFLYIFQKPGSFNINTRILMMLLIIALITELHKKSFHDSSILKYHRRIHLIDAPVVALFIICFLHLLINILDYWDISGIISESAPFSYMIVGYFLLKRILIGTGQSSQEKFLFMLALFNSLAAFLFIIHQGFGTSIYPYQEYFTTTIGMTTITRSFGFMPPLLQFSIIYLILKPKFARLDLFLIILNIVAVLITFTRSMILGTMFIILIAVLLRSYKDILYRKRIRNLIIFPIVFGLSLLFLQHFLPVKYQFIMSRFEDITLSGNDSGTETQTGFVRSISQIPNVRSRNEQVVSSFSLLSGAEKIYGMGFVTEEYDSRLVNFSFVDSSWITIIIRTGILGVIIMMIMFIIFFRLGLANYRKGDWVSLALSLSLVGTFIHMFVARNAIFDTRYHVLSLWLFAFIRCRLPEQAQQITTNSILQRDERSGILSLEGHSDSYSK